MFCIYKKFFGEPSTGIHKLRFMKLAVWDVVMTLICAVMFAIILKKHILYTVLVFFSFGILMHRLFCVRTTIDKLLFTA